jgi:hypothetical protein
MFYHTESTTYIFICELYVFSVFYCDIGIFKYTLSVKNIQSQQMITNVINKALRVITKLPNTEQSSKGKGKTHKSTNRQNQSTTGKLGKPQWP